MLGGQVTVGGVLGNQACRGLVLVGVTIQVVGGTSGEETGG